MRMRTITRIGATLSVVAALALYGVQLVAALGVAVGVILTGLLSGLSVAKWLERDWYGRQFSAGARAGAIACGVGGLSSLLYLLGQGPHSLADLAARSHLLGINLGPLILALAPLGWAGADGAVIVSATALGIIVSGLVALIAAASKSGRAVRVVAQARLAAQAFQQADGSRAPLTGAPHSATYGPQLYAAKSGPGAPSGTLQHSGSEWDGLGLPGASAPAMPRPRRSNAGAAREVGHPKPAKTPVWAQERFGGSVETDLTHQVSKARSTQDALTEEARTALSKWEDELGEFGGFEGLEEEEQDGDTAATQKPRAVNPSSFLTSPPPVGKPRKRKRQDTGDWLC
jgi:hypothetical protein